MAGSLLPSTRVCHSGTTRVCQKPRQNVDSQELLSWPPVHPCLKSDLNQYSALIVSVELNQGSSGGKRSHAHIALPTSFLNGLFRFPTHMKSYTSPYLYRATGVSLLTMPTVETAHKITGSYRIASTGTCLTQRAFPHFFGMCEAPCSLTTCLEPRR